MGHLSLCRRRPRRYSFCITDGFPPPKDDPVPRPTDAIHEIYGDGRTVWVNGPDGSCLGRFGLLGVDIHRSATDQINGEPECLVCTHGRVSPTEWRHFVTAMAEHHGIQIPPELRPNFLDAAHRSQPAGQSA